MQSLNSKSLILLKRTWKILSDRNYFSSENLDFYLKELAKEYRRLSGKNMPAEITLIGGAAILANYGFRDKTYDIDAIIHASSAMKEAINHVGDKYNLPNGWINADFQNTTSYTPKLENHSKHYKQFSNIVDIRTVSEEYLVAMKLMASRPYKHDLSDVAGIIAEHRRNGKKLEFDRILNAVNELYGDINNIPESSVDFLLKVCNTEDLDTVIEERKQYEAKSKERLIKFKENHNGTVKADNTLEILAQIEKYEKE